MRSFKAPSDRSSRGSALEFVSERSAFQSRSTLRATSSGMPLSWASMSSIAAGRSARVVTNDRAMALSKSARSSSDPPAEEEAGGPSIHSLETSCESSRERFRMKESGGSIHGDAPAASCAPRLERGCRSSSVNDGSEESIGSPRSSTEPGRRSNRRPVAGRIDHRSDDVPSAEEQEDRCRPTRTDRRRSGGRRDCHPRVADCRRHQGQCP